MSKMNFTKKGFTLIELMVSLAIFAFMTAFLLSKYGTFNQNTLLTDVAYDTALTIRGAQSFGLNVQGSITNGQGATITCPSNIGAGYTSGSGSTQSCFYYAYGVYFSVAPNNQFILFVDLNPAPSANAGFYVSSSSPSEVLSTYTMNKGYTIQSICAGAASSTCSSLTSLNITFRRPNPDAIIDGALTSGGNITNQQYAKIVLTADGITQSVVVQSTGEISITN